MLHILWPFLAVFHLKHYNTKRFAFFSACQAALYRLKVELIKIAVLHGTKFLKLKIIIGSETFV